MLTKVLLELYCCMDFQGRENQDRQEKTRHLSQIIGNIQYCSRIHLQVNMLEGEKSDIGTLYLGLIPRQYFTFIPPSQSTHVLNMSTFTFYLHLTCSSGIYWKNWRDICFVSVKYFSPVLYSCCRGILETYRDLRVYKLLQLCF